MAALLRLSPRRLRGRVPSNRARTWVPPAAVALFAVACLSAATAAEPTPKATGGALASDAPAPAKTNLETPRSNRFHLDWKPSKGEAPTARVCPLMYDKKWAYAVEIDDGPASTYTVVAPLLAERHFTNAPPGVAGGAAMPFVGTAAVMVLRVGAGNDAFLSWEQLRDLRTRGWGVANHSYWHSGNHWDPKAALDDAALRRELFWSQSILAAELGRGGPPGSERAPIHFVYPNGYTAYGKHLREYGLLSASRVAGKARPNVRDDKLDWTDVDRNYLDEGVWAKQGDPFVGLPKDPAQGDVVVDFTHGIDADPKSANHRRWKERLERLASRYGKSGDDSIWCASTNSIAAYELARRRAVVRVQPGKLEVALPADQPGSALTIQVSGIKPETKLKAPEGSVLHRRGADVWITTPTIGPAGSPPPLPAVERIYHGPLKRVRWDAPIQLAAVRVRQNGGIKSPEAVPIVYLDADGKPTVLASIPVASQWGLWHLHPTVPTSPAPLVREVQVEPDPALQEMEVWAVKAKPAKS